MSAREIVMYTKGARVWVRDSEEVWVGAEVVQDYKGNEVKVLLEGDRGEKTIVVKSDTELPPLRNPDILVGRDDLTSLSNLHEPAVLYNLKYRFLQEGNIYTYCGIVLVAINPYKELDIYGNEFIQFYSGCNRNRIDPHVYAIAEEAYSSMCKFEHNQSIIVTGESGAGKTVSAKYAMRYFATVGAGPGESDTQMEKKVLASNPIMEAIGNAKTIRNDNSSRFGKYIEIGFSKKNLIIGANMRTYLLEKSRVVFQAAQERNYHIFYQLCAAASEYKEFMLSSPDDFYYTSQGESPLVGGVDDADEFDETRKALQLIGVTESQQLMVFRILAAILHFGNVDFLEADNQESCKVSPDDISLSVVASLLGIDGEQMQRWLCNRKIVTVNETMIKPLTESQSIQARDALAKHIYAQTFDWIVGKINVALHTEATPHNFIGVLDIYGFEMFETNSFEQFCINYANEKLQQQFTQHVFKLEQDQYVEEGIVWSFIDFYDNQPCIALIEEKLGILDLLDEECKMPNGNDANWCQKLYAKHLEKSKHFAKPRMSRSAFVIHHFADDVQYETGGFLEKNRDMVIEDHLNILRASQFEFVAALFREDETPARTGKQSKNYNKPRTGRGSVRSMTGPPLQGAKKQHTQTVGSQFRSSLTRLMQTLNATIPHYIRCIKPNDEKAPFVFEPKRAVEQLRACGVLETIRISSAGYPSRWSYPEFFVRYRALLKPADIDKKNIRRSCENVLQNYISDPDKFQFGKTKIFFRAGQVAYLEKIRLDARTACCVMMQKHVRGWLAVRKYNKIKKSVLLIQCAGRGVIARRLSKFLKLTRCAKIIQKTWRGFIKWKKYNRLRRCALSIQAYARGLQTRKLYIKMLHNHKAIIIQKYVRMWLTRRWYKRELKQIILVQCCARRRRARKELKVLKVEARSVEHFKKLTRGMENKVISLQQKVDELNKEKSKMKNQEQTIEEYKAQVTALKKLEIENKTTSNKVIELDDELTLLKKELAEVKQQKSQIEEEYTNYKEQNKLVITTLEDENNNLKESLKNAENKVQLFEVLQNEKMDKEKEVKELTIDVEEERSNRQKLLKDYSRLEQRFENLQEEWKLMNSPINKHKRNVSNVSFDPKDDLEIAYPDSTSDVGEVDKEIHVLDEGQEKVSMDAETLMKLRKRVKELEADKRQLQYELEGRETPISSRSRSSSIVTDTDIEHVSKLKSFEEENQRLKEKLESLNQAFMEFEENKDSKAPIRILLNQVNVLNEENEKHRHEILNLKSKQRDQEFGGLSIGVNTDFDLFKKDPELMNEDGELQMAFLSQRQTIQLLEAELKAERKNFTLNDNELREELRRLRKDNQRQQKLISRNLVYTSEAKTSDSLQHEVASLNHENVEFREKIELYEKEIKRLKKQVKLAASRLKSRGVDLNIGTPGNLTPSPGPIAAAVQRKDHVYMGMYAYKMEDESNLIRNLVIDLKPKLTEGVLPGLPSYIIFMCLRHADYTNNDTKVKSLLVSVVNGMKKSTKRHGDDFESVVCYLVNTCRLLHLLKQYSGEKNFTTQNTKKQNEHCLRNFDISEYRQVVNDLAVHTYQGLVRCVEKKLQTMIVPGMVEHEGITGAISSMHDGMSNDQEGVERITIYTITKQLSTYLSVMHNHGLDPQIVKQLYKQIFYLMTATTLNNLVLRKEMCHWSKGMQIRYNVSELEEWLRGSKLVDSGASETLEPLVQVSQLLQVSKKVDQDVDSICELCTKLSTQQIIKILNHYTPVNEFETRVEASFVRKVHDKLRKSRGDTETQKLLMDTKHAFPVTFPYNPSTVELDTITIPESWNLNFLERM